MSRPDLEIRFSHLKLAGTKSPAHLRALLDGAEEDPTYAMERGSATHAILFGTSRVTSYPGAVRRGKEWEAFEKENADAIILTRNDHEKALRMADALRKHAGAMDILAGQLETTLRWTDCGIRRRCTPDAVVPGSHAAELKTCATADPARFTWQAIRYGYHAQLADQLAGIRTVGTLGTVTDAYIVAIEATEPHPITILKLTPRALEQGAKLARLWFERVATCLATEQWPPYAQDVVELNVPDDDELKIEFSDAA